MSSLIKLNQFNNKTVEEIQNTADKVVITKDQIKMQKKEGNQVVTIQIDSYNDGKIISGSNFDIPGRKKDLRKTILKMLDDGEKQKDIAFRLGISQSLVSKIKRER